ncbi:protein-L-isoaspartate O-methyltransferase [Haloquadratum walsbyi]|jgi:Protein-L-isoaspartate carboxylmethyltransferase|uniref:protein-L-isoaspartate(D-aspartate) O-methyltransferase n=1 Tax=Haloquadratum walsbyi J07HQW2 TaxID=1238425 RepID=U1NHD5_9EURY|nr:protein-L-isoaspartate O-methyltransferase [Haloquadratum walsbyi]ERG96293.1 MAG: protein-L-isoaspartate carboxylmethyltransferase [Haloquadratum walsbyi J07HQW2]
MDPAVLREDMVNSVETKLDISVAESVSQAMRTVPRKPFVEDAPYQNSSSEHVGTTILAPSVVARLLTALHISTKLDTTTQGIPAESAQNGDSARASESGNESETETSSDDVLVVGAGVGYTAAVLAELVNERHVHAIDIDRRVVYTARSNLESAGYGGVLVDARDGAQGLPEYAPFDRILVEAASIEPPRALLNQLTSSGRLVIPLGGPSQTLSTVDARGNILREQGSVAFNPLLVEGENGEGLARNRTVREDAEFAESGYFAPTGWEQEWIDWDKK